MSKKAILYLGFFAVLVLGFFFVVKDWLVQKRPISYVHPFSFENQDGKLVTNKDVDGKVYVAEYFFTTCPGICPRMNTNMKLIYEKFKGRPDFLILSHTSDPERDSASQLKRYADSLGVDTRQWVFLTGRKDSLYKAARVSYTIDDPANNVMKLEDQFIHTSFWALVNKQGEVEKIYDGIKESEVEKMSKDIEKMLNQ